MKIWEKDDENGGKRSENTLPAGGEEREYGHGYLHGAFTGGLLSVRVANGPGRAGPSLKITARPVDNPTFNTTQRTEENF